MSDIFDEVERQLNADRRGFMRLHGAISRFGLAVVLGVICLSGLFWFGGGYLIYQAYVHRHEVAVEAGRLTQSFEDGLR